MKHARFLKNAAIVSVGGLLARGVGALYRIPLANLLGGYGDGLYHMAYPLFCLMLTLSSAGVSTVMARAAAAERASGYAGSPAAALRLFGGAGALAALLMCLLAAPVARLQGEGALAGCYLALAPAVLPAALLSVLRGWRQGMGEMTPAALSEIAEQLVKAGAGLLLASRFAGDPLRAARAALFAVTLSELLALFFVGYGIPRRRLRLRVRKGTERALFFSALPVMLGAALMPLSQMLDSVLIVRLLSRHTAHAVRLYGLYAGGAVALVSVPATLCCGLVAAAVPAVAACFARGEAAACRERALFALAATFALSLPCAAGLLLLAPAAVRLLYPALPAADAARLVRLMRVLSVSCAVHAAVGTLSACLAAMGRSRCAALSTASAVAVKALLECLLVARPAFGIMGAAIAFEACDLVAFFLDLFYTVRKTRERTYAEHHRSGNEEGGGDAGRACRPPCGGRRVRAHRFSPFGRRAEGGGDRL